MKVQDTKQRAWPYVGLLCLLIVLQILISVEYIRWETMPPGHDPAAHLLRSLDYTEQFQGKQPFGVLRFLRTSDYYPPLWYWTSAPFQAIFGPSVDAGSYSILLYFAIALIGTFGVGKRLFSPGIGLLGATLLSLYPIVFGMSRIFYPDMPLLALTIVGFYCLLRAEHFTNRRWSIVFGLATGLAFLIKWTYPLFISAPFLYSLWVAYGRLKLADGIRKFVKIPKFRLFVFWYVSSVASATAFVVIFFRLAQFSRPLKSLPFVGIALFHVALIVGICSFYLLRTFNKGFPRIHRNPLPRKTVDANLFRAVVVGLVVMLPWYPVNYGTLLYRLSIAATQDAATRGMPGIFLPESMGLYLFYLEGHQVHLLFFILGVAALLYHLRRPTPEGTLLSACFGASYLLLCGIRLKDPRFSMPFLPFLALLTSSFMIRAFGKASRSLLTTLVLAFGAYQLYVVTFGDERLPEKFRIPEKVIRRWNYDAEAAVFKKYGYGSQFEAVEDWKHEKVFRQLEDRLPTDVGRKALVRVIGNHHQFHYSSLEFLARCGGHRLRFLPGLAGEGLSSLLDADFILTKVGKNPGPDAAYSEYKAALESLEEKGELLNLNYEPILWEPMPDGDQVIGYKKRAGKGIVVPRSIDWGIGKVSGYRISTRECTAGEPFTLAFDWYLTPELVRSYVFFAHLVDKYDADIGDFVLQEQRPFKRFEGDIQMGGGMQGPVSFEYVVSTEMGGKPLPAGDYQIKIGIWNPVTGEHPGGNTPEGPFEESVILWDTPVLLLSPKEIESGDDVLKTP